MATDPISPIDAKLIAREVINALKKEHSDFWIDPKTHYDCHQNFNRWVEFFDGFKATLTNFGYKLVIIGIIAIAGIGVYHAANF